MYCDVRFTLSSLRDSMDSMAEKLVLTNDTEMLVSDNLDLCVSESPSTIGFGRQGTIDNADTTIITNENQNDTFVDSIILPLGDICNKVDFCSSNYSGKLQQYYRVENIG